MIFSFGSPHPVVHPRRPKVRIKTTWMGHHSIHPIGQACPTLQPFAIGMVLRLLPSVRGGGLIYRLSTWPQLQGMWIFSRCMQIISPPCGINDKLYGGVVPPPSYNLQHIRGVTRLCHYHYKPTIMVDVFYLFIKVKSF
jgi:hypothetical protein